MLTWTRSATPRRSADDDPSVVRLPRGPLCRVSTFGRMFVYGLTTLPMMVFGLTTDISGTGKASIAAVGMLPFAVTAVFARVECSVDYASREFRHGIGKLQIRSVIVPGTTFAHYRGARSNGEPWNGIAMTYPPNPRAEQDARKEMRRIAREGLGLGGSGFLSTADREIWLQVLNGFEDRYQELAAAGVIEGMSYEEFRRSSWKGPGRLILADGTALRAGGTIDPDCRPIASTPSATRPDASAVNDDAVSGPP